MCRSRPSDLPRMSISTTEAYSWSGSSLVARDHLLVSALLSLMIKLYPAHIFCSGRTKSSTSSTADSSTFTLLVSYLVVILQSLNEILRTLPSHSYTFIAAIDLLEPGSTPTNLAALLAFHRALRSVSIPTVMLR